MSYQQCTRFRTTVDFDREYLWNGSSNRQAETAKKRPWPLTYDLDIKQCSCRRQNTIKLSAAVRELLSSCFYPISQKWKIRQSGSLTLTFDLWFLKSIGFFAVVKVHVRGKFHRVTVSAAVHEFRGHREKKLGWKQYSPSLPRGQ